MRFLIFEDNADTVKYYRRALARMFDSLAGFDLRIAQSIPEGLEILKSYQPDTIWLDLNLPPCMPDDTIKHIPGLAQIADVIVVSDMVETRFIETAILAGANDFIPKSLLFDSSTEDGKLGIMRLTSRFGNSFYRTQRRRIHGNQDRR